MADALTTLIQSLKTVATTGKYSDLTGTPVLAYGTAALPTTLLAGATQAITVTLKRAMASTTYGCSLCLSGATVLLGGLMASVTARTTTTVTVTVKNTGLISLSLSGTVEVTAIG